MHTVLRCNNGPIECHKRTSRSIGTKNTIGSSPLKAIEDSERNMKYWRQYRRKPAVKKKLRQQRHHLKLQHFDCARKRHDEVAYIKNQLERETLTQAQSSKLTPGRLTKYNKRMKRLTVTWKKAQRTNNERLLKSKRKREQKKKEPKMSDCLYCKKTVQITKIAYCCGRCRRRKHVFCDNMVSKDKIKSHMNYSNLPWYCDSCKSTMNLDFSSCTFCTMTVSDNQKGLSCDRCKKWQHIQCQFILSKVKYNQAVDNSSITLPTWFCCYCKNKCT